MAIQLVRCVHRVCSVCKLAVRIEHTHTLSGVDLQLDYTFNFFARAVVVQPPALFNCVNVFRCFFSSSSGVHMRSSQIMAAGVIPCQVSISRATLISSLFIALVPPIAAILASICCHRFMASRSANVKRELRLPAT